LARESGISTVGRPSRDPFVWAAGSAVLSVLLFVAALLHFVTSGGKPLWQTVFAVAVFGILIVGFERPFMRLGTFVHGWNFIWSIYFALFVLLKFYELYIPPVQLREDINGANELLWAGAVGNAILAAFGLLLIIRGARGASNVILSITSGLITVGLVLTALGSTHYSFGLSHGSGAVLFAASFTSLLESVVVLVRSRRELAQTHKAP
jgi:hypothetical protein